MSLNNYPPHDARNMLLKMEKEHGARRRLVWAELGEAPLARAIGYLAVMAEITKTNMAGGTVTDLATGHCGQGWKADDAVVRALSAVDKLQDFEVLTAAIRTVYLPWAEDAARHLQKIWGKDGKRLTEFMASDDGTCLFFVDGLRFDCGKRLAEMLEERGFSVAEKAVWAALPSVTGTGKPAIAPLGDPKGFAEEPQAYNFEPLTPYQFKKAIEDNGWKVVTAKDAIPSPVRSSPGYSAVNKIWCEFGDIDHEGHDRGWKLSRQLSAILEEIRDRVESLFAGWESIRIVTDHGWLLMPGGLPKIDLPSALTETKWGRCASLKSGASTAEKLFPWYWNPNEHFALADGVSCFRKGEEYAHGGLSMQECLTLELTVTKGSSSCGAVEFADITWKGMRCAVTVRGNFSGLSLDIRTHAGDPDSSIVAEKKAKPLKDNGTVSAVVENEQFEGEEAFLVLIDSGGALVGQVSTVIGGGGK